MANERTNSPWVLIELDHVIYAISCDAVLSLNQVPEITPLPAAPREVRGVIKFRTKLIQLIDTRILLNRKSIVDEINDFDAMIDQRYKDHTNWLSTLEKNVKEDSEFTLTTDPHKCAFGKWYDSYIMGDASLMFSSAFAKFDEPHKAIHQIGITAKNLVESGRKIEAVELIDSVKNTELKQMMHLFGDIKEAYKEGRRETVVVLGDENKSIGISVDQITSIEILSDFDENFIKDSVTNTEYLSGVAKRKDGSIVLLLNDEYVLSKYH